MSNREIQQMNETESHDDGEELPANRNPIVESTPTEKVEATADAMSAFNSLLWEIAKTFGIITTIFMAIFFLFMAYQIAQWGMTTL